MAWNRGDPRRRDLVARRCRTVDEVARWVMTQRATGTYPELSANAALVLIGVACALLDRQLDSLAKTFTQEGGFTERLYRIRRRAREIPHRPSGPSSPSRPSGP